MPSRPPVLWPIPFFLGERKFFLQSSLDRLKAELAASALGVKPAEPAPRDPDPFVPFKEAAHQLGISTRQLDRRVVETRRWLNILESAGHGLRAVGWNAVVRKDAGVDAVNESAAR